MKKFLISFIGVAAIVFAVDFVVGKRMDNKYALHDTPKLLEALHNKADIAMIGASVMFNQYVPSIIQDTLGMSCYNYGVGGQNIYYHYATAHLLFEAEYKPKIVLYQPCFIDLENHANYNTEKLDFIYSAYNYDSVFHSIINQQGCKQRFLLNALKLYKHNTRFIYYSRLYLFAKKMLHHEDKGNGYSPLNAIWQEPIQSSNEIREIDSTKCDYLDRIIELCEENNALFIMANAPEFENCEQESWLKYVKDLVDTKHIPYLNYHDDSTFLKHPEWFYNPAHLNGEGAVVYSKIIAGELREIVH